MTPEIKGKFITFEGLEGAGKSTQAERLYSSLLKAGYPVVKTREPGGTDLGDAIRSILADRVFSSMAPMTEALLFSAARYEHIDKLILPAVQEGKIIICDRFADATVAYQCFGRGLDLELINQVNLIATKGIKPDLTFFLDIEPEKGFLRVTKRIESLNMELDRIENEKSEFFLKVRQGYLYLAKKEPERFKVIKAEGEVEEIYRKIEETALYYIKKWGLV